MDNGRDKLLDELNEANRENNAKTEFMVRMSHDMRVPLAAIMGLADIGLDSGKDIERYKEIRGASETLLELLEDVLFLQELDLKPKDEWLKVHDLLAVVESIYRILKPKADKKNLHFNLEHNIIMDNAYRIFDEKSTRRILTNLIDNAIQYTPVGGEVTWKINNVTIEGKNYCKHTITDNGIGMSKVFQEIMYESFSKERDIDSQGGSGLGLSIVKRLIQQCGGQIHCQSEMGKGTIFEVNIPETVQTKEGLKEIGNEQEQLEINLNGREFLIAEDAEINAHILIKVLESRGAKVDWAHDGAQAVECDQMNHYDLIIMDIRMPIMDGLEAASIIRTFDCRTPIIALSANAYEADIQKSLGVGMNAHLAKTILRRDLFATIETILMNNE